MGWWCGSSGRVLAYQFQSLEFKPQQFQKKKKRNPKICVY
jgi:hypothetical protein